MEKIDLLAMPPRDSSTSRGEGRYISHRGLGKWRSQGARAMRLPPFVVKSSRQFRFCHMYNVHSITILSSLRFGSSGEESPKIECDWSNVRRVEDNASRKSSAVRARSNRSQPASPPAHRAQMNAARMPSGHIQQGSTGDRFFFFLTPPYQRRPNLFYYCCTLPPTLAGEQNKNLKTTLVPRTIFFCAGQVKGRT